MTEVTMGVSQHGKYPFMLKRATTQPTIYFGYLGDFFGWFNHPFFRLPQLKDVFAFCLTFDARWHFLYAILFSEGVFLCMCGFGWSNFRGNIVDFSSSSSIFVVFTFLLRFYQ